MGKLIDADAAIESLTEYGNGRAVYIGVEEAVRRIEQLPSAQPERPTGEWIQKPRYEDDEYPDVQPNLKCPFCGYEIGWCDMGNYCARCGADLRGDENE